MICPKCKEEAKRSKVKIISMSGDPSPRDIFWDEDGIYHCHADMKVQYNCVCDNSHKFLYTRSIPCLTDNCNFVFESVEFT